MNEWIESFALRGSRRNSTVPPKCFACRRRRLCCPLSRKMCLHRLLLRSWSVGISGGVSVRSSCPSLREYASDPSWMEYSVRLLRLWQGGRQADWLTNWLTGGTFCFFSVFVNLQIWLLLLGFPRKSIELYFLYKIKGPVDWAAARAVNITGIFSHLPCRTICARRKRSLCFQWLIRKACEWRVSGRSVLGGLLNLLRSISRGFVFLLCVCAGILAVYAAFLESFRLMT